MGCLRVLRLYAVQLLARRLSEYLPIKGIRAVMQSTVEVKDEHQVCVVDVCRSDTYRLGGQCLARM